MKIAIDWWKWSESRERFLYSLKIAQSCVSLLSKQKTHGFAGSFKFFRYIFTEYWAFGFQCLQNVIHITNFLKICKDYLELWKVIKIKNIFGRLWSYWKVLENNEWKTINMIFNKFNIKRELISYFISWTKLVWLLSNYFKQINSFSSLQLVFIFLLYRIYFLMINTGREELFYSSIFLK